MVWALCQHFCMSDAKFSYSIADGWLCFGTMQSFPKWIMGVEAGHKFINLER
jgi:hypothetical protein